jgi:hypothetical protein
MIARKYDQARAHCSRGLMCSACMHTCRGFMCILALVLVAAARNCASPSFVIHRPRVQAMCLHVCWSHPATPCGSNNHTPPGVKLSNKAQLAAAPPSGNDVLTKSCAIATPAVSPLQASLCLARWSPFCTTVSQCLVLSTSPSHVSAGWGCLAHQAPSTASPSARGPVGTLATRTCMQPPHTCLLAQQSRWVDSGSRHAAE